MEIQNIESISFFDKNTGDVLIDDLGEKDLQEEDFKPLPDHFKRFEHHDKKRFEYHTSEKKCFKCGQPMHKFYLEGGFQIEGLGIDCHADKAYICENCGLLEPIFNSDLDFNVGLVKYELRYQV